MFEDAGYQETIQPIDAAKWCMTVLNTKRRRLSWRKHYHLHLQRGDGVHLLGLVPRYPLQKSPSSGQEGSRGERGRETKVWRSKGPSPSEGFKGASRGLRGFERGFKEASRGLHLRKTSRELQGGFKGLEAFPRWRKLREAWRWLEEAWRRLQGGFTFGRLQEGLAFRRWRGLWRGLKGAWKGFKEAWREVERGCLHRWSGLRGRLGALHQRFGHV